MTYTDVRTYIRALASMLQKEVEAEKRGTLGVDSVVCLACESPLPFSSLCVHTHARLQSTFPGQSTSISLCICIEAKNMSTCLQACNTNPGLRRICLPAYCVNLEPRDPLLPARVSRLDPVVRDLSWMSYLLVSCALKEVSRLLQRGTPERGISFSLLKTRQAGPVRIVVHTTAHKPLQTYLSAYVCRRIQDLHTRGWRSLAGLFKKASRES